MPAAAPVVVGSADAAGDGATEIFVLVNEGCCKQVWTIFRQVNGHLTQVSLRGRPVELTVGDTAGASLVPVSQQRVEHLPELTRFADEVSCGALPQYAA